VTPQTDIIVHHHYAPLATLRKIVKADPAVPFTRCRVVDSRSILGVIE
jgi:hypothetical protein